MPSVTTPQGVDSFIDGLAAFNLSQCFCWWGNQSRLKHDASCCPIRRNRTRLNTRHAGFPESASRERHVRRAACQHQCESFRLVIHARQVHHLVEIKTTCGTHRRRPAGLRCNIRVYTCTRRTRTCTTYVHRHAHNARACAPLVSRCHSTAAPCRRSSIFKYSESRSDVRLRCAAAPPG